MDIVSIFIVVSVILTIMFSWFKTNVVYEYGKLFGLGKYLKSFDEYPNLTLPQYLYLKRVFGCVLLGVVFCKIFY